MSTESRKPHFLGNGVHHATINGHRFHLRPHNDGALLWLNGQQPPYHLDQTATNFVKFLIDAMWKFQQGEGDESAQVIRYVVDRMMSTYRRPFALKDRVTRDRIKADLDRLFGTLMGLAEGACPVEIGLSSKDIKPETWTAPARMDLALTYRCNLNCAKCYNGDNKIESELSTQQWLEVYRILWKIGIPHIVFTGGEPTLRDDLIELIGQADEFVTGLVTNGTRLEQLAEPLRNASLDYTQVTIESLDPAVHDGMTGLQGSHAMTVAGIKKALEVGLQVVTNTTLTKHNAATFTDTLRWLHGLGIKNMACNTLICSGRGTEYKQEHGLSDEELKSVLVKACNTAAELGASFQWYSPGCYKGLNPIELGLGQKSCSAAAHNMLIQPDGSVLPCQSWPEAVGNILKDPWKRIWNNETCRKLREHLFAPEACEQCAEFAICGGGCPLDQSPRHQ